MSDDADADEEARLAALDSCAVMDTAREIAFDSIVFTAAQLFRAPIAAIAIIGADAVWAKASVGRVEHSQPRAQTLVDNLTRTRELLVMEDALADGRYAQLATVAGPPYIRFFAGAPVFARVRRPGEPIGTPLGAYVIGAVTVADRHPRSISDRQRAQLLQLARDTEELIRLRVESLPHAPAEAPLR